MSTPLRVDLAVVGAGPAGLAAATTAAEHGLRVAVVDAGTQPGGQYWRHLDEQNSPQPDRVTAAGQHDWRVYLALRERFDRLRSSGAIAYRPGRQVWFVEAAEGGHRLHLETVVAAAGESGDCAPVWASTLVLAPGGYDRQLPVPGWDLPGTMAAGGVQALLKGHGSLAGRRAIVAGTGPFLLPVATGLAAAGVEVVAVCEAAALRGWVRQIRGAVQVPAKARDAVGYARAMVSHRIPYRTRTVITQILGVDEVQGVRTDSLGPDGRLVLGRERVERVDLVALGWGFTPSLELITAVGAQTRLDVDGSLVARVDDDQRSSVTGVYVAGEATGVGGAALALLEGELAGLSVAIGAGGHVADRRRAQLRRGIRRGRAFASALHQAHPIPAHWTQWLTPATLVCRCEEVDLAAVTAARDDLGATDARTVKLLARPGMGWCQGRVCGFATAWLATQAEGRALTAEDQRGGAKRPLCTPVTLARLADTDATPRPGEVH